MLPRYSPIPDSDVEKQPLVAQPYSTCHCQQVHEQQRRRGPSTSSVLILTLLILLALGYGHQYRYSYDPIDLSNVAVSSEPQESPDSLTQYCHDSSARVPWDGKSVYDLETGVTGLSVEQKLKGRYVSLLAGNTVVVENKALETPKVTFDIKLEDDQYQDSVWIDEVITGDTLSLIVKHTEYAAKTCVRVDVKVEVPSASALDNLSLHFPNNDITLATPLQVKNALDLAAARGDLTVQEPAGSSKISLSTASGNVHGVFDVDQVDFSASAASGNLALTFDHISATSTIKASSASGNVGVQVPSDFQSQLDLSVVVGNVNVKATETDKLHVRRTGGIVGHTVHGYYGTDVDAPSHIKLDSVSGNVKLNFQ